MKPEFTRAAPHATPPDATTRATSQGGRAITRMLGAAAFVAAAAVGGQAGAWSLKEAAAPYKGTTISIVGLERPSYEAAKKLTPEFEKETGIKVKWTSFPYENTLKEETLNFVANSEQFDVILSDVVWPVNFAGAKWTVPLDRFMKDPKLADPALDMKDFFPVWLASFTVDGKLYGLPFDSYAGLLYYNKSMLKAAGIDKPPATWDALREDAKKLTDKDKGVYGYALQSARGETQTADAFARFLWPWGGSFLNIADKKVTVNDAGAVKGMEFRQSLLPYMPSGIVADDHSQVVELLNQKKAAMITEWSAFYPTLSTGPLGDDLGIAPEPVGPDRGASAFGGFAYMISSQVSQKKQDAGWLFVQWLTSKEMAKPLIENGAVVARMSADKDPALQAKYPNLKPMVETWEKATIPDWRPQLQCYPRFSDIVSNWGSEIELGQVKIKEGLDKMAGELTSYMNSSNCWANANTPQKFIEMYK
ncbi:ABC transporter substrate-binding protein [Acidimangrovimonas sediminis]|uniref:ABC transporter substrate-binding protein n=1 Tax=Acidimangrovimonas sediminis TaxID=2056283 RepID=UPI0018EC30B5|nr:sugar ABC transporter substrate-binding protein [Acidimangrovimonas sediminis]